ncbi:MAG TPA: toxin-antitoxin system YwqK family antitoxin, partial [Bdellovibrionota bacterium]
MNQLLSLSKSVLGRKQLLALLALVCFSGVGHGEGTMRTEGKYRNGKQEGDWKAWHANGRLAYVGHFRSGKEVGISRTWSEEGVLLFENRWKEGGTENSRTEYYPNGTVRKTGTYRDGHRHFGLHRKFYPNGREEQRVEFTDSIPTGVFLEWYADGKPKVEGRFLDGKRVGEWKEWHENGRLSLRIERLPGGRRERSWYANGNKKSVAEWKCEALDGRSWNWREDGS